MCAHEVRDRRRCAFFQWEDQLIVRAPFPLGWDVLSPARPRHAERDYDRERDRTPRRLPLWGRFDDAGSDSVREQKANERGLTGQRSQRSQRTDSSDGWDAYGPRRSPQREPPRDPFKADCYVPRPRLVDRLADRFELLEERLISIEAAVSPSPLAKRAQRPSGPGSGAAPYRRPARLQERLRQASVEVVSIADTEEAGSLPSSLERLQRKIASVENDLEQRRRALRAPSVASVASGTTEVGNLFRRMQV